MLCEQPQLHCVVCAPVAASVNFSVSPSCPESECTW